MEELTAEILEVDEKRPILRTRFRKQGLVTERPVLLGTSTKDFRMFSGRLSYYYSSYYTTKRELDFQKTRTMRWL
jgi:hypothetical protein